MSEYPCLLQEGNRNVGVLYILKKMCTQDCMFKKRPLLKSSSCITLELFREPQTDRCNRTEYKRTTPHIGGQLIQATSVLTTVGIEGPFHQQP